MNHDEAARQAREFLAGDHSIPTDIGQALLAGYEAAEKCITDMETYMELGSPNHMAKRLLKYRTDQRGPKPGLLGYQAKFIIFDDPLARTEPSGEGGK